MAFDYSTVDLDDILKRCYNQMDELQRPGVGKARATGRTLFNVWMGVGKTFMALTAGFCFKPQVWLIICSKNAIGTFQNEIEKWFPEFSDPKLMQIVRGQAHQRYKQYANQEAFWFVTTAGSFIRDIEWLKQHKVRFDVITIDEIHKIGLRNRKSAGFKALKELVKLIERNFEVKLINPMTGTWTSKGPPQQFPVLNLLIPKVVKSYWNFVNTFCITVKGAFGTEIAGPKNTAGLAQVLSMCVYTVDEKTAKQSLPELRRIRLYTELPPQLEDIYYSLAEELFFEHNDEITSVSTILASYTKLRQLVNCPETVKPGLGVGPAIEIIVDKILEDPEIPLYKHNIVFSPFVPAIPIFKDYLSDALKIPPNKILIAKGGMETEELRELEKTFRRDPETMIISSLRFSQSWNAETCRAVFFPHFEWDQDENKQAEGRSRRKDGVQEFIPAYYVDVKNTITGDMFNILNQKEYLNKITYQDVANLKARLKARMEARNAEKG